MHTMDDMNDHHTLDDVVEAFAEVYEPLVFERGDVWYCVTLEDGFVVRPAIMLRTVSEDQYEVLVGLDKHVTSSVMVFDTWEKADQWVAELGDITK